MAIMWILRTYRGTGVLLLFATILSGCEILGPAEEVRDVVTVEVPAGFDPVPIPAHNPLTPAKVELGRRLFEEPLLSRTRDVSCASCHRADIAFTDGVARSTGVENREGLRNSPSLINVAYQRLLFWDGGSLTLEAQVLAPLENEDEMDIEIDTVLTRLRQHPEYPALFEQAFGEGPTIATLTQAIASFERTLVSTGSRYDRFVAGDESALTAQERNGMDLFFGDAGCASCHSGFLFTDQSFRNKGLQITRSDSGRARITLDPDDFGRFKVPSLRNVALTAPYMHDGRYETLAEVVDHVDRGGDDVRGRDPVMQPLNLTDAEKNALVAFLGTLTDERPAAAVR